MSIEQVSKSQFSIPESAIATASCIVGRTGSGKTFTAKGIVESLLDAGRRVCIVDPTGAWWGLRLRADGSEGFPVIIFGGDHGDVPINDKSGERLGEIVASGDVSQCIVDVSEFSTGEATRFLTAFFEALYSKNRGALHLVLDEADMMAPQNPMPETRRLQGVVNKIVRRGRIKGFRPMMITQRPQVIDKSVLSQVDTLIALRLSSPQDRKAILEWVKGHSSDAEAKGVLDKLASLKVGTGFVWSPANDLLKLVTFPKITTFDSSRAPEADEEAHAPTPIAGHKISDLRQILASEVDEPVTKGRKAARLFAVPETIDTAEVERAAYERGHGDGYKFGYADGFRIAVTGARLALDSLKLPDDLPSRIETSPAAQPSIPAEMPREKSRELKPRVGGLPGGARALLDIAAHRWPARFSWTQLCTMNGTKARGGHFNTCRKALMTEGLISEEGGLAIPTDKAFALIGIERPNAASAEELRRVWLECLPGPADKMLAQLIAITPSRTMTIEALGQSLGMAPRGGHWNTGMRILRDNDLIEFASGGIRAAAHLWTEHRQ